MDGDARRELLARAVRSAADGDALISQTITAQLPATFAGAADNNPPTQPVVPLRETEEEVLLAVARGRDNAEIAEELHLSLSTVK